jgi:tetratricopeptide (TPR) repeat protein
VLLRAARRPETIAETRPDKRESTAVDGSAKDRRGGGDPAGSLSSRLNREAAEQLFGQHFRSGYQNFQSERYSQAVSDFERATKVAPHLAEGHYYLGESYSKLFLSSKAEEEYRQAVALMSDFRPAQEKLAEALHGRGAYQEAIELLARMDKASPDDPYIQGELAINYLALGQPEKAIPLLEKYIAARPTDAWGDAQLGHAQELAGRTDDAERLYRKAIKQDRHLAIAHHWLGLLLARSDRESEAKQSLAEYDRLRTLQTNEQKLSMALLGNPSDVRALVELADTRYQLGKTKLARQTLERAEATAPGNKAAAQLRARWRGSTDGQRD